MAELVRRGDIFLVSLDPTLGEEIQKSRPCVIVSPNELNMYLHTFIVAPLTTESHNYPYRVPCRFQGRTGHVVIDQIRTIDRVRLVRRLGKLPPATVKRVLAILQEMFAP